MQIGYKFRWYPAKEQEARVASTFGCTRFAYNWFKQCRENCYNKTGKDFNYNEASKWWTVIKTFENRKWLKEINAVATQQALRHCDQAFKKFFKGESEYLNFKKKNGDQKATYMSNAFKLDLKTKKLYIAGLGNIENIKWSRTFCNKVSSITITKSSANKYYISFTTTEEKAPLPSTCQTVGIDLGLKDLATLSNDTKVANPKFLAKNLRRLKHLQRELARKVKGSNRRGKAKLKLVKQYEKIANIRRDFLHKLTIGLVRNFDLIKMEDLNVKGMMANHKLALAISDVGWGTLKWFLTYKCTTITLY